MKVYEDIAAGSGMRDIAQDCMTSPAAFRKYAATLAGKHPVRDEDLAASDAVGTWLLQNLGTKGGKHAKARRARPSTSATASRRCSSATTTTPRSSRTTSCATATSRRRRRSARGSSAAPRGRRAHAGAGAATRARARSGSAASRGDDVRRTVASARIPLWPRRAPRPRAERPLGGRPALAVPARAVGPRHVFWQLVLDVDPAALARPFQEEPPMNDDDLSPDEQAAYDAEMAVIEALVDAAIVPYARLLSRDQLARMRECLVDTLATHPNATELVAALAKRRA